MNSIESYSPPKVTSLDGEAKEVSATDSDPAALEMLRAMMGGVVPQSVIQPAAAATVSTDSSSTVPQLLALLEKALKDDTVPPSLLPFLKAAKQQLEAPASSLGSEGDPLASLRAAVAGKESGGAGQNLMPGPLLVHSLSAAPAEVSPFVSPLAVGGPALASAPLATGLPQDAVPTLKQLLTALESASSGTKDGQAGAALSADALAGLVGQLPAGADKTPAGLSVNLPVAVTPVGDSSSIKDLRVALTKAFSGPDETTTAKVPAPEIEPATDNPNLGQSILQSLGAQSSPATAPVAALDSPAGIPTADRIEQVSSLMSQMADRVMVADPVAGQKSEVRIKIAENIIPGTEVRVSRELDGQLRVEFETVSPYWARVLNDASPLLTQRLNEKLPLQVPPQVLVQQQGGQPEDGRSRNRQNPWQTAQQFAEG